MSMPVISPLDFTFDRMIDESVAKDSPMQEFYRSKTAFVTGGTGFLGILYIEKLLRCEAKAVYVLVRPKKNKTPAERVRETFDGIIFSKLKQIDPHYMTRIKLIEGDTCEADLGISGVDRQELIENVEIVIHSASNVRFDRPLHEMCYSNVRGTKALTLLAEEMKKLIVFAYISTAISQFNRDRIEEKFYPPPCDPDELIRIVDHFDKHPTDKLDIVTAKLLEPWDNTYVYSKALSEELVRRIAHKLPAVVVRPSIVISTHEDPIPGWTNNFYGLNGFLLGINLGFIRVTAGQKQENKIEIVCADFVINGTLAAMWHKVNVSKRDENLSKFDETDSVVHITSQDRADHDLVQKILRDYYSEVPSIRSLSTPFCIFAQRGLPLLLLTIMYHVIPGILMDAFFCITNNKIRFMPLYRKYQDFLNRTAYFGARMWQFDHSNMKRIIDNMTEDEQRFFPCDIFKFKFVDFLHTYYLGLRTYLSKEPLSNVAKAKRRYRWVRLISLVTSILQFCLLGGVFYLLVRVILK